MNLSGQEPPRLLTAAYRYWSEHASRSGFFAASRDLVSALWEFIRDSTPERLRRRFGDADYDWDHHVNTTSGAVGWRDRLLGVFHSAYQPTEPAAFHAMLNTLKQATNLNFADFTFVDLGSGKGRTLLMAADYPFRRILGVELLPSLHEIAKQNLSVYKSDSQKCFAVESLCADATAFSFPEGPLVLYLFNPLAESGLRRAITNLRHSLDQDPRPVYTLYHNPELEQILIADGRFKKIAESDQYSVFSA